MRLSRIARVEIDDAVIDVLALLPVLHLQTPHLLLIEFPLISNHLAARKTPNWNNH
jgi:hypothetical protein